MVRPFRPSPAAVAPDAYGNSPTPHAYAERDESVITTASGAAAGLGSQALHPVKQHRTSECTVECHSALAVGGLTILVSLLLTVLETLPESPLSALEHNQVQGPNIGLTIFEINATINHRAAESRPLFKQLIRQ
jgi:hypothetical protein